jgi:hypothetical protein
MPNGTDGVSTGGAAIVMNPRSGGGKVSRFQLVERTQAVGASQADKP